MLAQVAFTWQITTQMATGVCLWDVIGSVPRHNNCDQGSDNGDTI